MALCIIEDFEYNGKVGELHVEYNPIWEDCTYSAYNGAGDLEPMASSRLDDVIIDYIDFFWENGEIKVDNKIIDDRLKEEIEMHALEVSVYE